MKRWRPGTPAVVRLPSLALCGEHRIYPDAGDPARVLVDALEARVAPHRAGAPRAPSLRRPARPVSIAFGPEAPVVERAAAQVGEARAMPMAWHSGPFFAWVQRAGGVTLIDHGQTDRGCGHAARIEGNQPPGVELAQAVAAAELVHYARLHDVTVKATAGEAVTEEIRELVRVGRRAAWTSTLADALTAVLIDLLRRERLQVTVASAAVPLRAFDEIRELVLMEWAHRLAGGQALSLPAAGLTGLIHRRGLDLSIDWRDGDRVPLRVVRTVRYESIAADSLQALTQGLAGRSVRRALAAR